MKTVRATRRLETLRDGITGTDLGVIGLFQFALARDGVYRRRASEVGSYGGWRWECNVGHPARFPSLSDRAELARRIAEVAR